MKKSSLRGGGLIAVGAALILAMASPGPATAEWGQEWGVMIWGQTVSDVPQAGEIPAAYQLFPNVPNPFNPGTTIEYALPQAAAVDLRIYSLDGRLVRVLETSTTREAGHHRMYWDGKDDSGSLVSSGVYLYRLDAGQVRLSRRMVLLK